MQQTDPEGLVEFTFTSNDLAGNSTTVASANTGSVLFDRTPPVLTTSTIYSSNAYFDSLAKVDDVINITFTTSEEIQSPTVFIGGLAASVTGEASTWSASRAMTADDVEGVVSFTIDYMDLASNEGVQGTETIDSTSVTFDNTPPTLTGVNLFSDNIYDNTLSMVGDRVTLTFSSVEVIQIPVVTIGEQTAIVNGDSMN